MHHRRCILLALLALTATGVCTALAVHKARRDRATRSVPNAIVSLRNGRLLIVVQSDAQLDKRDAGNPVLRSLR